MRQKYNLPMRFMHWVSGLLFIINLGLGWVLSNTEILKGSQASSIPLHKSFGVLVFFLLIIRLLVRSNSELPEEVKHNNKIEKLAEKITHFALYFFLIAIPFIGIAMSNFSGRTISFFGLFNLPSLLTPDKEMAGKFYEMHMMTAYIALGFIGLHILATIKHYIFNKENLLKRMV
jgi:cytochrome b561